MTPTQATPVRFIVVRPKSYLVTVLVGEEETEPWEPGWVPRSQLNPDPGYEEGDVDILALPLWLVGRKGWHLPKEKAESPAPVSTGGGPPLPQRTLDHALRESFDKHESGQGHHWDIHDDALEEADQLGIVPLIGNVWW